MRLKKSLHSKMAPENVGISADAFPCISIPSGSIDPYIREPLPGDEQNNYVIAN